MTPKELLDSQVREFNNGNIDFLMTLYEKDACFASEPGEVISNLECIHNNLQGLINSGIRLDAKVKRTIYASDLALLITEWSLIGAEPANGRPVNLLGNGTIVLRRQPDGTWLMVIENPWGTS